MAVPSRKDTYGFYSRQNLFQPTSGGDNRMSRRIIIDNEYNLDGLTYLRGGVSYHECKFNVSFNPPIEINEPCDVYVDYFYVQAVNTCVNITSPFNDASGTPLQTPSFPYYFIIDIPEICTVSEDYYSTEPIADGKLILPGMTDVVGIETEPATNTNKMAYGTYASTDDVYWCTISSLNTNQLTVTITNDGGDTILAYNAPDLATQPRKERVIIALSFRKRFVL